jgi:hypothetical protein
MLRSIIIFIKITIPGNIERLLDYANAKSNMGLYGAHLIIYYSRNLCYFFTTIGLLFFYFNYIFISLYFISFGLLNHIYNFYKWNLLFDSR